MIVPGSPDRHQSHPPPAPEEIRAQVERIVGSAAFRNSKRFTALLRHLVERTLEGREGELKERLIGAEVFGRSPDYDSNSDPIVRTSAGELRRRIAQYYHEADSDSEIRIDLPVGSYVPEVSIPKEARALRGLEVAKRNGLRRRHVLEIAAAAGLIAAAIVGWSLWARPSEFDQFWQPVLNSKSAVSLCVALTSAHGIGQSEAAPDDRARRPPIVALADVAAIARLAGLLESHKQPFRLQVDDRTTLDDLRRAPAIMVGAFNDIWTLRITDDLRFSFRHEGPLYWIQDTRNPSSRAWGVDYSKRDAAGRLQLSRDYALISRVLGPKTGQPVITVAGAHGFGTEIAAEYITNPAFVASIASQAPAGWQKMNAQIVISTDVIDDHAGPPRILAMYFWR